MSTSLPLACSARPSRGSQEHDRCPPRTSEAERLVIQRSQDVFRDALMDYWGGRCPLMGSLNRDCGGRSIVPWANCTDEQRLNVHNGLLLSALWDAAFDRGLISFADDGSVLESPQLTMAQRALDPDMVMPLSGLRDALRAILALHRAANGFQ